MLKNTGVELQLITDPHMHQMGEKSMCGGISNSHRYATSNHPSIDAYSENEEPRTLTYIKMLIRCTHGQCHKCFLFKWVSNEIDILNVPDQLWHTLKSGFGVSQAAA